MEILVGFQHVKDGIISWYGKAPDWKSVIGSMDANNDDLIDYGEFLAAATNRINLLSH